MKKIIPIIAATFLASALHAQHRPDSLHFFKPQAITLSGGMNVYNEIPFTLGEMRKIAPSSVILSGDFSSFTSSGTLSGYSMSTNALGGLLAEFVPYSKKKNSYAWNSVVRAGLNYASFQFDGESFSRSSSVRYDTVTSGNMTFYMDSTFFENYSFSWNTSVISADLSQLFHSNEAKLFSIGIGYGIQFGAGINSGFTASYFAMHEVTMTQYPGGGGTAGMYSVSSDLHNENELVKTKNAFFGRIYVPLQFQLRLSRKNTFWNKLALTSEIRTSLDFVTVPNLGLQTHPCYFQNFGIKYYFQNNSTETFMPGAW
ncbi:MAG: hypothetical protein HY064_05030 [Bacteroidetes bacterium]|nr:hypothetical protein [Bacteroidota bacterium]